MEIPVWAILTTLAYNIMANLLTPPIQKYFGSISTKWKERNEARKRVFDNSVQFLIDNPLELIYLRVKYAERNILAFIMLIAATALTLSTNVLLIFLGILLFITANILFTTTNNNKKLIDAVWKYKKEKHPEIQLD